MTLLEISFILGAMGAQHIVLSQEEVAYADWINRRLANDNDTSHFLPLAVSEFIYCACVHEVHTYSNFFSNLFPR